MPILTVSSFLGTLNASLTADSWNAAIAVSNANDAEDDEAAYKETADNYADAFMGQSQG